MRCTMLFLPLVLYLYFSVVFELMANVSEEDAVHKEITHTALASKTTISYFRKTKPVDTSFREKTLRYQRRNDSDSVNPCEGYKTKCLYKNALFTCENINQIELREKIGHGVTKQAFLGFYRGENVVVKMVTRHQKEARECLDGLSGSARSDGFKRSRCFIFPTMKLMKEILLLQQLQHEGFLRLLGYCVRSEESDSTDLTEHGVVAVYEKGTSISVAKLTDLPVRDKILQSLHLISFFQYLANSPLGSLRIRDFKIDHFLMVNSTIKMIDLDDVDNLEPSCDAYSVESNTRRHPCRYGISCEMGLCQGHNAKRNLERASELFFRHLLSPDAFPRKCFQLLQDINQSLRELSLNYNGIRRSLTKLLNSVINLH